MPWRSPPTIVGLVGSTSSDASWSGASSSGAFAVGVPDAIALESAVLASRGKRGVNTWRTDVAWRTGQKRVTGGRWRRTVLVPPAAADYNQTPHETQMLGSRMNQLNFD